MVKFPIARSLWIVAMTSFFSAVCAAGPSNSQYSIPSSTQNSGVDAMNSTQYQLRSSVGDGFGLFAMSGTNHSLSPGFWGTLVQLSVPTATISVSPSTVPDNGTSLVFTVTLNPPPPVATPITIASAVVTGAMTGVVNGCTSPVVVSPAGTGSCTISATNIVAPDGPATATVTLGSSAGWALGVPSVAVGNINDNDNAVNVTVLTPFVSAGSNAVFNIVCGGAPSATVDYGFSGDYVPLPPSVGSVVVACGAPIEVIVPTVSNPTKAERSLTLTLTSAVPVPIGIGSATITIIERSFVVDTMSASWMAVFALLIAFTVATRARRIR
jgi:hypothetical protein